MLGDVLRAYFTGALATRSCFLATPDVMWRGSHLADRRRPDHGGSGHCRLRDRLRSPQANRPAGWPRAIGYALAVLLAITNASFIAVTVTQP